MLAMLSPPEMRTVAPIAVERPASRPAGIAPPELIADAIPASDGTGTIVNSVGSRFDITGGQRSSDGVNLFHSFQRLGLDATQTANFLAAPGVLNILGRVTGGEVSILNGLIQVSGYPANLYLMNPAGIVFGPNARLDVPGAFAATTATGIGFGSGSFNAIGASDYAALLGNPDRFAFATLQPGAIINAGNLVPGGDLLLLGGTVISTGTQATFGGQITIAAVPGSTLVRLSQSGSLLSLEFSPLASGAYLPPTLPELLTTGVASATGLTVRSDGSVQTGAGVQVTPGDVVVGNLSTNLDSSTTGSVLINARGQIVTGTIDTSATVGRGRSAVAGAVNLVAGSDIRVDAINAQAQALFGNVQAGAVSLTAGNSLTFDTISTEAQVSLGNATAGAVTLASDTVRGTGTIAGNTITTQATSQRVPINGTISIQHSGGPDNVSFAIGDSSVNGTAGAITTGTTTSTVGDRFSTVGTETRGSNAISVTFINTPPVLTIAAPPPQTLVNQPLPVTLATLGAVTQDINRDNTTLQINAVTAGTLTRNGVALVTGDTVAPNDALVYTPPADATGTIAAFSLRASDRVSVSAPVAVAVTVTAPTPPTPPIPEPPTATLTPTPPTPEPRPLPTPPQSAPLARLSEPSVLLDRPVLVAGRVGQGLQQEPLAILRGIVPETMLLVLGSEVRSADLGSSFTIPPPVPRPDLGYSTPRLPIAQPPIAQPSIEGYRLDAFAIRDLRFTGAGAFTGLNPFQLPVFSNPFTIAPPNLPQFTLGNTFLPTQPQALILQPNQPQAITFSPAQPQLFIALPPTQPQSLILPPTQPQAITLQPTQPQSPVPYSSTLPAQPQPIAPALAPPIASTPIQPQPLQPQAIASSAPSSALPTSPQVATPGNLQALRPLQTCVQQAESRTESSQSQGYAQLNQCYTQTLEVATANHDRPLQTYSLNNLATTAFVTGDYTKAIAYHQQQLKLAQQGNDRVAEGIALSGIGAAYGALGDYPTAIDYYNRGLERIDAAIAPQWKALTLRNLGSAYLTQNQPQKAIGYQEASLQISRTIGDRSGEAQALGNLGNAYAIGSNFARAIDLQQQSLAIARQLGDQLQEAQALLSLGTAYSYRREFARAIDFHQQSLVLVRQLQARLGEGIALNNLGDALLQLRRLTEAETALTDGIGVWESLRAGLGNNDAFKVAIFETQADTYRNLQEVLIAQNRPLPALEIAERGRARAFVELLAKRSRPTGSPTVPPPTLEQIRQTAIAQKATIVQYTLIREQFVQTPHSASVQFTAQAQDSELFIWVVQPNGTVTFRRVELQNTQNLIDRVTSARSAIGSRGRGLGVQASATDAKPGQARRSQPELQRLYQLLIAPIADLLPTDPDAAIVFVPQEQLFLVPFAALQTSAGRYLIEDHTVLTTPAIQVLQSSPARSRHQATQTLIVGNPSPMPSEFSPLPGSELEATEIGRLLNVAPIVGAAATETAIKQKLPSARLIHLATHGVFNEKNPMQGAIVLAPSATETGLLTAEEILQQPLDAELVVLSACDTGRGRITGDGVLGLSRSLMAAGASNVVVSLWQVPDAPTASLMTEFYRDRLQHPNNARSLRHAMLKTLQTYPNPVNWAAFTLVGSAD